ncbi:hypothetical protein Dthio_PD2157 [Desulfonatronospira thiodismutans ASO3-1]|uniref:Uncharacterized protein n=1 Tax=Desulfonatronospira thiodismutans ASO3-1 TaxID=555779 RepID=D6SPV5_9BACT|nr:hypothetical protein [Desulfonatronospira thiodismutans]EFI34781.1 hypothetical protein Dthio_PD2157 [Desulfonatronospira thiodismutans ASO3-1]
MNRRSVLDASFDRSRGGNIHAEGDAADIIGYAVAATIVFTGTAWAYVLTRKKNDNHGKPARKKRWR